LRDDIDFLAPFIDVGLDGFDVAVEDLVDGLLAVQDLQQRVDGGEVRAPEDGGEEGTEQRHGEPTPVRPGVREGAEEVLHGRGWLAEDREDGGGVSAVRPGCNTAGADGARRM